MKLSIPISLCILFFANIGNTQQLLATCQQITARYVCESNANPTVSITSTGDIYKMPGIPFAEGSFRANGHEQLVSYFPGGLDRDAPYEAYIKAQCTSFGFDIQTRNTEFSMPDSTTGQHKLLGHTTRLYQITVAARAARLSFEVTEQYTDVSTGAVTETKRKFGCKKSSLKAKRLLTTRFINFKLACNTCHNGLYTEDL